jgi:hypothetical protein
MSSLRWSPCSQALSECTAYRNAGVQLHGLVRCARPQGWNTVSCESPRLLEPCRADFLHPVRVGFVRADQPEHIVSDLRNDMFDRTKTSPITGRHERRYSQALATLWLFVAVLSMCPGFLTALMPSNAVNIAKRCSTHNQQLML